MIELLTLLSAKATPYIIGGGAILLAFVGTYVRGRLSGSKLERDKQTVAERRARDIKDEVQNDVGAMSPDHVRSELAKRAAK